MIHSVDFHLQLKQSQFRTPIEVLRKNFKCIQKLVETQKSYCICQIKLIENTRNKQEKLDLIDATIRQQEMFSSDIERMVKEHNKYISKLKLRVHKLKQFQIIYDGHTGEFSSEEALAKYAAVYREEINLLLIDFLLKSSYMDPIHSDKYNSGVILAKKLGLDNLIDYDVILQGLEIYNEIKFHKNLKILIKWCTENKKSLKAIQDENDPKSSLKFETYFQSFIENVKLAELSKALEIASEYLVNFLDMNVDENLYKIASGAALLCWNRTYLDDTVRLTHNREHEKSYSFYDQSMNMVNQIEGNILPLKELLEESKWSKLADFFLFNFNSIYGISQKPDLLLLLSVGATALKTRSCVRPSTFSEVSTRDINFDDYLIDTKNKDGRIAIHNECPICSPDLYELTHDIPFSHQVKSNIYDDPVMLPNGNIYQYDKLISKSSKISGENFDRSKLMPAQLFKELKDSIGALGKNEFTGLLDNYEILDPLTGEVFKKEQITKVFPT
ncbi:hypothetical protein KL933_004722 [Ogataea haglerorum]|uniref:RING-Gid-type domain-containing protein n=1 Tax=Ogataea haglerorum TaxID=1937702 RepID=A0AAN6HYE7_9ASCO|nr:hypothetical protein KL950_002400 [Ogataea haglerorum]KAG7716375.1 hypothetical protein KL913_003586 [Ogataea haglerorum]KAG7716924.1 hypothetical protein KL949_003520 [Ogataea haglerorum]KAG7724528.1 hypothetical protein KL933_004722 [Ogataea haglerorum]KAG7731676.1 hypothetical protein KL948_002609 [Ogataea haglerorum]